MTTATQHVPITLEEALDAFRAIVKDTGPEFVYELPVCRYLEDDDEQRGVPSCAVGRVAAKVRPDTWLAWSFIIDNTTFSSAPDTYVEPDARKFLHEVQARQDRRHPYGSILTAVEAIAADIAAGDYEPSDLARAASE